MSICPDCKNEVTGTVCKECGLVFNDAVKRTLSEAKEFHQKVISNRREFLAVAGRGVLGLAAGAVFSSGASAAAE